MGAYKKDQICHDFDTVMRGVESNIVDKMKIIAVQMIESLPDNRGRDFAISNLLHSAELVRASIVSGGR